MAKSFAEAFQLAQAVKSVVARTNADVLNSSVQVPPQSSPDRELWTQQVASVKPLDSQHSVDLTIETVTGASSTLSTSTPIAAQPIAVADARQTAPAQQPRRRQKNDPHPSLEEYYERLAQRKAAQSGKPPSQPRYPHLQAARSVMAAKPVATTDSVILTVEPGAKVKWDGTAVVTAPLLKNDLILGTRTQISGAPVSEREVVLGFDFGTSSAKIVIGDRGLKKAHAVPFRDAIGIDAYLLPARLYKTNGSYSLREGAGYINDLKLALLAKPDDLRLQCLVVAYLALAIREARAWLFSAHAEDYAKTTIVWTLALGLPAEHSVETRLSNVFARLGNAAWVVSQKMDVSYDACRLALGHAATANAEVEVTVTPEIAAQIYGFVNSSQFDAKARNFYLMADVGAGTVDACLFRAVPARGGEWSFEIYTATVEAAGVMNLHRHRIGWWQKNLARDGVEAKLSKELENIKLGTENQAAIPASYDGYLSGVKAQFAGKAVDPDKEFFRNPLRQIQSRTLHRAFGERLLGKQDMADVPFFLCGGGARLDFYRELREAIQKFDGCSWLSTQSKELVIPDTLRADGVGRSDYDRLSVAYGLSMLNLANILTAQQIPKLLPESSEEQWRRPYVDKDQC